jgi:hypothetical protein
MDFYAYLAERKRVNEIGEQFEDIIRYIVEAIFPRYSTEDNFKFHYNEKDIIVEFYTWYGDYDEPYYTEKFPSFILNEDEFFIQYFIACRQYVTEYEERIQAEELKRQQEEQAKYRREEDLEIMRKLAEKHNILIITPTAPTGDSVTIFGTDGLKFINGI